MNFDVIIIGAGPSGIASALEAKKIGLNFLLIEKAIPGGRLHTYQHLDHFPRAQDAQEYAAVLLETMQQANIESTYGEVRSLSLNKGIWQVITDVATYHTHVVILATGTIDKKLNIPGEDDFLGRGVSFCAECDGGFFQDQDVAVIGDSAYALREVIHLSTLAQRVYWIQSFPLSQASPLLRDDRVTILAQALPIRINGEQAVQSLVVDVQGTSQTLSVAAVFPCLGVVPHTAMIRDLQVCADDQSVVTGQNYQTPLNGLFAIGDVKQQSSYRLQSALEDGKNVMKHIQTYLKNKSN